jgi:hypothetical protein
MAWIALAALSVTVASSELAAGTTDKEIEAKISAGLKAYQDGRTGEAISALQEAIAGMQKSQHKGMAAFFPKAPEGWEAGKLDSASISANSGQEGGSSVTTLTQEFTRKSDDLKVTVTLANSPELIKAQEKLLEVYKNPEMTKMMNANPDHQLKVIDENGWTGLRQIMKEDEGKGSASITAFSGACILTLQVQNNDGDVLDMFWKTIDLKGLAAAAPKSKPVQKADSE